MQLSEANLDAILKGTSRAFYLSLAVLPPGAAKPMSLAYLLARAADTIADTPANSQWSHRDLLLAFRQSVVGPEPWCREPHETDFRRLIASLSDRSSEKRLLESTPRLVVILRERPEPEREAIRRVVATLIDGMLWDQQLFDGAHGAERNASDDETGPLASGGAGPRAGDRVEPGGGTEPHAGEGLADPELERYTYLVAGCVGPFWSEVCALAEPELRHLLDQHEMATEFGKGLQWVNILRDVPEDQRIGRYYLPDLRAEGFRARFADRSRRALRALSLASRYPLLFPRLHLRHRMAVFWPLVLGLRTLERLFRDGGPRPDRRNKVARWEVLGWVALSPLIVVSDSLLAAVLDTLWRRAEQALSTLEATYATDS